MNPNLIREKFGDDYIADERTFIMGIDHRFTTHLAERFNGCNVLETCTGAGFTTIALAKTANSVLTVEIDASNLEQAKYNVEKAGLSADVSFVHGNILDRGLLSKFSAVNAAFIDPDWAATGPDHVYRFIHSNTKPPADHILETILEMTKNVALVLPPFIDVQEFSDIPAHERE